MYRLKITKPGNLLSVVIEQEITPAQVSIVTAVLKADLTYGEALAWLANRLPPVDYDAPVGAGESVEAFRGDVYTVQATNRGTVYRIHYAHPDSVAALFDGGPTILMLETGWSQNHGEWIQIQDQSVAWSYLAEKMPEMARRDGDREGWVKAFAAAGIEVFGWRFPDGDD